MRFPAGPDSRCLGGVRRAGVRPAPLLSGSLNFEASGPLCSDTPLTKEWDRQHLTLDMFCCLSLGQELVDQVREDQVSVPKVCFSPSGAQRRLINFFASVVELRGPKRPIPRCPTVLGITKTTVFFMARVQLDHSKGSKVFVRPLLLALFES